jgi:hypothetical protein
MAMLNEAAYTAASLLIVSELIREKTDLRFQLYSFDTIAKTKERKMTVTQMRSTSLMLIKIKRSSPRQLPRITVICMTL